MLRKTLGMINQILAKRNLIDNTGSVEKNTVINIQQTWSNNAIQIGWVTYLLEIRFPPFKTNNNATPVNNNCSGSVKKFKTIPPGKSMSTEIGTLIKRR